MVAKYDKEQSDFAKNNGSYDPLQDKAYKEEMARKIREKRIKRQSAAKV